MLWERLLTMSDYYDGPRRGIAEADGKPYVFESIFDDFKDGYSDSYLLSPIDDDLLALALEDWAIWSRWHAAWQRGEAPAGSHPALPAERARHNEIERAIGERLSIDPRNARRMKAQFRNIRMAGSPVGEVCWSGIDDEKTPAGR